MRFVGDGTQVMMEMIMELGWESLEDRRRARMYIRLKGNAT